MASSPVFRSEHASLEAYWAQDAAALLRRLDSGLGGLSRREAARRRFGLKSWSIQPDRYAILRLILKQFKSPLVLILVAASLISVFIRDWVEASVVLGIVFTSTILAFSQEYVAHRTFHRLSRSVRIDTVVRRSGVNRRVPADSIVPGDIVILEPGMRIPADCILLSSHDLYVNQAAITGESFPALKSADPVEIVTPFGERRNCVFAGSSVESGAAEALVVLTGIKTIFGQITEKLSQQAAPNEFERGVARFGRLLMQTMFAVVLLVLTINLMRGQTADDALMFALAIAVGLTPELLPAIISVMLARGARHLAHHGVIVRKLNAIESLGGMTVLCTDKTGTLTEGQVRLTDALDIDGMPSTATLRLATLNARFYSGLKNPIDQAVLEVADRRGLCVSAASRLGEIPLDFARRCVSVCVHDPNQGDILVTKGAFDAVLERCICFGADAQPLDAASRQRARELHRSLAERGFRVLAVASRRCDSDRKNLTPFDEQALCFSGVLCFLDPTKSDTPLMIRQLSDRGVSLKIITGDDQLIAHRTAELMGLSADEVITGSMLMRMSDQALTHSASKAVIFSEVDPSQKERIVRALQRNGEVVGFLGDGVNDALALHTADVGISVHNAVDVAREASDFVLLRKELSLICAGIDEGRRTFSNTMKYILSTTSANFGNMISLGALSLFLPFLPLLPSQILLNNFLSDIPSAALSGDRVDAIWVREPHRFDTVMIRNVMIFFGLISVCFDFALFAILFWALELRPEIFRTAWFVESLLTELVVLFVIRSLAPVFHSRPSWGLILLSLTIGSCAFILPYSALGSLFELEPLPIWLLAWITLLTVIYALAVEVAKRWFFANRKLARDFAVM